MVKYNLKALISDKEFRENRKITYKDISKVAGISETTLSKIASKRGYHTSTVNIERLCNYFRCQIQDLIEIIPDPSESAPPNARE